MGALPFLLAITAGACDGRREQKAATHSLIVAYGADEFPLTANRQRLARYPLNASVCETLVRLTSDFRVAPGLATRWEPLDSTGARFILRSGVRFSDGSPLTTHDVAFTLAQSVREKYGYSFLGDSSMRVIDDTTIEVRSTRPNRRLVEQLVHATYAVLSPKGDAARSPLCTGPFRVAQYLPYDHLTVVRNEQFAGAAPRLDTVTFRFIPDENTRALAVRAADVDVSFDVGTENVKALEQVPGLRVVTSPPGAVLVLYINQHGKPPFEQMRDSALRRAVASAIDRHTLVDRVIGSSRSAFVTTINPPRVLGEFAASVTGVPFDTIVAKALAGRHRRPLRLIMQSSAVDRSVAEYVQAELAATGLTVDIESLDAAAWNSRLNDGMFDLDLELPNQNDANPAFLLALRWYSASEVKSAAYTHASARFDTLVVRALRAPDAVSSRRESANAMHQLVDLEVGAIPLAGISRNYVMRDRVKGFVAHPARLYQDWSSIWLER